MNKIQKWFLICWGLIVCFMGFNVWNFLTPNSIILLRHGTKVLGWDSIVAFVVIACFMTVYLYFCFSDKLIYMEKGEN